MKKGFLLKADAARFAELTHQMATQTMLATPGSQSITIIKQQPSEVCCVSNAIVVSERSMTILKG
jgi:hypothetical protein